MPVILDRLPLPNISWYTGISILCLLCSVYYAGVQVKLHPDWKEQLQLRQAAAANRVEPLDTSPLFDSELDNDGQCYGTEESIIRSFQVNVRSFIKKLKRRCVKETFEDIVTHALYPNCYLRYNSLDESFQSYFMHNTKRMTEGNAPYKPGEYFQKCKKRVDRLIAMAKKKRNNSNRSSNKHSHGGKVSSSSESDHSNSATNVNKCSSDSFYDSYERDINSEVSVYHIPLTDGNCDEREMSPYLIPEIISFMFHEPLCIWTLINMAYCILILMGTTIQHMVFGELRVSEQQHIKDKFWNFVFYKFIFVFGVMNVKHMDEAVLWCSWFSVLGFLHLLAQLCKDRFEYLSFSGYTGRRTHIRLLCLLGIILLVASACLIISVLVGCHAGINTFAFMAAECILLIVRTLYVITRYSIYLWDISHQGLWEKRGSYVYATELVFELSELIIDMVHHMHMLVWGNIMLTMASLVICMQLRLLFYQLQHKVKTHRNFLKVRKFMASYPEVITKDESTTCPICWEIVKKGRQLPCNHLFHTSCLLDWLPHHLSCPICRYSLKPPQSDVPSRGSPGIIARLFSRRSSDPLQRSNSSPQHTRALTLSTSSSNTVATNTAVSTSVLADGANTSIVSEQPLALHAPEDTSHAALSSSDQGSTEAESDNIELENTSAMEEEQQQQRQKTEGHSNRSGERDESDAMFWSGTEEEGRYVSWLPSFSVEQRHTQLTRQHTSAQSGSSVPESSQHAMAVQVMQLFPGVDYDAVLEDLSRTRSLVLTVDNILEKRLPIVHSSSVPWGPIPPRQQPFGGAASPSTSSQTEVGKPLLQQKSEIEIKAGSRDVSRLIIEHEGCEANNKSTALNDKTSSGSVEMLSNDNKDGLSIQCGHSLNCTTQTLRSSSLVKRAVSCSSLELSSTDSNICKHKDEPLEASAANVSRERTEDGRVSVATVDASNKTAEESCIVRQRKNNI